MGGDEIGAGRGLGAHDFRLQIIHGVNDYHSRDSRPVDGHYWLGGFGAIGRQAGSGGGLGIC